MIHRLPGWVWAGGLALSAVAGRMSLVGAFVIGAAVSGALIGATALQLGRRYGLVLVAESALLAAGALVLGRGGPGGEHLLCMAAGLQNAMATTFSGAIVRTTHVTGVFTDLGAALGQGLRSGRWERRKMGLLLALAGGFLCGSALGAAGFAQVGYAALWGPAGVTGLAGLTYVVLRLRWRGRA